MACKYYKQKKQYSTDSGVTWYDVTPAVYRKGGLYEVNSEDCTYIDYSTHYLTFKPTEANTTFMWRSPSGASANTVYYSLDDGSTWSSLSSGGTVTVNKGNKIYWKASGLTATTQGIGELRNHGYSSFKYDIEGNIMSLVYGDDFANNTGLTQDYQFLGLFSSPVVVNTKNLILPATSLTKGCYYSMFVDCYNLVTTPVLPATTLAEYCYGSMFRHCVALTSTPDLPSTTLAENCYREMFAYCSGLTATTVLPATTMEKSCYQAMFWNCTSLTTAPALPATTLADNCYHSMFEGCTSLTTAPPILPAYTMAVSCCMCMFAGCTSLVSVPSNMLPATTISTQCYQGMFEGCTSLLEAPILPATELRIFIPPNIYTNTSCYANMFSGCTSLRYIKMLAINTLINDGTSLDMAGWVIGVAASGTFVKNSNTTNWYGKTNNVIPPGWTVQNA